MIPSRSDRGIPTTTLRHTLSMGTDDWVLLGAPWDCSARNRGEADAPTALRAAGLGGLCGQDLGDGTTHIRTPDRDAESGVLALDDTLRAAGVLGEVLASAIRHRPGIRPLVVGGDCSILLGIVPAVRHAVGRFGLLSVDGHPDYQEAHASDTGETADMALACVTGMGPPRLTDPHFDSPMVRPADAVLVGHRTDHLDEASQAELDRLPSALRQISGREVRADPAVAGRAAAKLLQDVGRGVWLHIDLDVLDPNVFPAVTYPQPDGLDWNQLSAAVSPLAHSPRLLGVGIADFRPDLDKDGSLAGRLVRFLGGLIEDEPAPALP